MADDLIYRLWFANRANPTNKHLRQIFMKIRDPLAIYGMSGAEFNAFYPLDERTYNRLNDKSLEKEKEITEEAAAKNINIISYDDERYPERLKNIETFPYILYHKGEYYDFSDILSIAVVGTRNPSDYGYKAAVSISRELAYNNVLVVSGMAMGVDAAAHYAAMSIGKPTAAVLGSGPDVIQPVCNKKLYEYMSENGCIYSEYPPGTVGIARNFPARNRIISGLCVGVLVVEAGRKSGSLITADFALEQGKDIFAVPNMINNPKGEGTNKLIKEHAIPVTCAKDILDEYSLLIKDIKNIRDDGISKECDAEDFLSRFDDLTPLEREVASFMKKEPASVNFISSLSNIPVDKVLSVMTMLEIKGVVRSENGNKFGLNTERND